MTASIVQTVGPAGFGSYEVEWSDRGPTFRPSNRPSDILLCPGFVDTHIHGGYGTDLMDADTDSITCFCDRMEQDGVEALLATTVTASAQAVRDFLRRLPAHRCLAGVHLEGPFIAPDFPGAQPRDAIVDPAAWHAWEDILADPRVRLVTLAPELPGADRLIAHLVDRGIAVSMGHSGATAEDAALALERGADRVTHTFNAMRPFHHREPGLLGFALTEPSVWCELIYDRHHVSRRAADILLRCKGPHRVVAVSDGTMAAGMPSGSVIEMWGQRCRVEDGVVRLESGALAGSAIVMLDAFRNLADDFGPEVAIRLCSINPRALLPVLTEPRSYLEFDVRLNLIRVRRVTPNP
ncbi:MAG TPA: amidohydrolase family protein [Fimbriimonadaceae bacterium]|nr:amidohydrolase family protein [Fimbriimonadaceae bacterium]HRJ96805.1 amidohydrolase family protein [Fimbriimonadaceae bacterium]